MHRILRLIPLLFMGVFFITIQSGNAQNDACPALVKRALESVRQVCGDLGRNSVCYGNNQIEASFDSKAQVTFDRPSDKAPVSELRTLRTFPLDEKLGLWGVALMNIQANVPNTLPGQGVRFVLYGDVAIQNRGGSSTGAKTEFGPMQAFYFTTGAGNVKCNQLPPSSLVIQSPKGINVHLNANGLDVSVGSTVAFTAQKGKEMRLVTLAGKAVTRRGDKLQVIPAGFGTGIELGGDDGLTPIGDVEEPQPFDEAEWQAVIETSDDVFEEPIDMPDTSSYDNWDDFCSDEANADACAMPEDLCADGWCESTCGDLICGVDEDAETCAVDCASYEPTCGDLMCDIGEDETSCPEDCGQENITSNEGEQAVCGDAFCDAGEDASTCAADCGADDSSGDSGSEGP